MSIGLRPTIQNARARRPRFQGTSKPSNGEGAKVVLRDACRDSAQISVGGKRLTTSGATKAELILPATGWTFPALSGHGRAKNVR